MLSYQYLVAACALVLAVTTACNCSRDGNFAEEYEKKSAAKYGLGKYFEKPSKSLKSAFDGINAELVNVLDDSDAIKNLDKAIEVAGQKKGCLPSRSGSKEALNLLIELKDKLNSCDLEAFAVLNKINYVLGDEVTSGRSQTRRIDRILSQLFEQHALNCGEVYLQESGAIRNEIENPEFQTARSFIDHLHGPSRDPNHWAAQIRLSPNTICWVIDDDVTLSKPKYVYNALSRALVSADDGKYLRRQPDEVKGNSKVDKVNVARIFKENVIEPCEKYIPKVIKTFIPAAFEVKTLGRRFDEPIDLDKPRFTDQDSFYHAMVFYRSCVRLVAKQDQMIKDLQEEVKFYY